MNKLELELLRAVERGDIGHAQQVLKIDLVQVNYQTGDEGDTALILAAYDRQENGSAIIKCLLDKGADINLANYRGKTPLMIACQMNKPHIVKTLLENGADYTIKTSFGLWGQSAAMMGKVAKSEEALDVLEKFIAIKEESNALNAVIKGNSHESSRINF